MYYDGAYAPFGETYAQSGSTDVNFTGMNSDTTPGLYDFPAREYSIQGRWPSPDPAGLAAADPSNPQSWNRYAYVLNNPLALTDPSGFGSCNIVHGHDMGNCWSWWWGVLSGMFGIGNFGFDFGGSASCSLNGLNVGCSVAIQAAQGSAGVSGGDGIVAVLNVDYSQNPDICTPNPLLCATISFINLSQTSSGGGMIMGPNGLCTPSVFNPDCKKPSCPAVFSNAASNALDLPVFPAGSGPEDAAKAAAAAAATKHIIDLGLSVPLRSSIVRNILSLGETSATAIVLVPIIYQESVGLYHEAKAWSSGSCTTIWSHP